MPLDTSTYALALLRTDGRRWNELRRLRAQLRVQRAADGSAYLEMGNTKVLCVVTGPGEPTQSARRTTTAGVAAGGGGQPAQQSQGTVEVSVVVAGFSSVDRKRRGKGDKRNLELQSTVSRALASTLHTHLFAHSTLSVQLTVLSQDGSLLAALLNAASLACVDAGVPMTDYLAAVTAGSTGAFAAADTVVGAARKQQEGGGGGGEGSGGGGAAAATTTVVAPGGADPLLDLNAQEETELPYLTAATLAGRGDDRVAVLVCESRVRVERLEGMLAVAVDGCRQVRDILDRVVREAAIGVVGGAGEGDAEGMGARGAGMGGLMMDVDDDDDK